MIRILALLLIAASIAACDKTDIAPSDGAAARAAVVEAGAANDRARAATARAERTRTREDYEAAGTAIAEARGAIAVAEAAQKADPH